MSRSVPTYNLYGEKSGERPDFWIHWETIASRSSLHHWEIKHHRHESFFQILYIGAGAGDADFLGRQWPIIAPAVITIPPGFEHGFRFSRDIEGAVITIVAGQLRILAAGQVGRADYFAKPHLLHLEPESPDARLTHAMIEKVGAEFAGRERGRDDMIEACLTATLLSFSRLADTDRADPEPFLDNNAKRMEQLRNLVSHHGKEHRPAGFYAEKLRLSQTHLNRICKQMAGVSLHDFIGLAMIDEAKRMLVFQPYSIQTIAEGLGFADPAYFCRFFLRKTGLTPKTYRNKERAKLENS